MATIRYDEERQMPKRRPRLKLGSGAHWAMYLMLTGGLLGISGFLQAGAIPDPLPLSTPQFRISYRGKELWIIPPAGPAAADGSSGASGGPSSGPAGVDQVAVAAFDSVNNALRVNALLTSGGVHTPSDANQVFTSIYDPVHNAIQINCVLGCTGGGGGSFIAGGDLAGSATSQTVVGLQTRPVAPTAPTANQVLAWNGSAWTPTTPASGGAGTGACAANQFVTGLNLGSTPSCAQPSFANLTGTISPSQFPAATGTSQGAVMLAGDLAGSASAPLVAGLQGRPVGPAAPSSGQALTWNGSAWTPTTPGSGGAQIAGDLGGTLASPTVVGLQTRPVAAAAPTANQVLAWSGSAWTPATPMSGGAQIAGDLGGTLSSPAVVGIQRVPISSGAPSSGQCLVYNGTNWGPGSCSSGSGGALLAPATSQTIQPTAGNNITPLAIAPGTGTTQTADLFDVWKDSAMTTKAMWVDASGNLNFLGNNATYGTAGQTTQSFLRLYGSTANSNLAPPYLDLEKVDGSVKSFLASSTSVAGLVCVSANVPGGDCAAGTTLAANPMTAAGDLIVGGTPNGLGVAASTRLAVGTNGQCLTSNGTTEVWGSCGSGSIALQTNGTNNASQTALNLVAGTNITLTNTSGGNVTIAAATGSLPSSWSVAGTTNAVAAQPATGQDATTLTLAPSIASPTADIFDVCSTITSGACGGTKYFGVQSNGDLVFSTSVLSLGTSTQSTASGVTAYGGVGAGPYVQLFNAEEPVPAQPVIGSSSTGGSLAAASYGFYEIYETGTSGQYTTTASIEGTATTTGTTSSLTVSIPTPAPAGVTYVVVDAVEGAGSITSCGTYKYSTSTWTATSDCTSSVAGNTITITAYTAAHVVTLPTTNTTGGNYFTAIGTAAAIGGAACIESVLPATDCAAGTWIMTNPMTAPGDLVYGGTINAEGFAPPQRLAVGANGQCLTSNGNAPVWAACGSGGGGATLQTNGTNNSSQTTLNLENGTGITVANPSGGNVTIGETPLAAYQLNNNPSASNTFTNSSKVIFMATVTVPVAVTFSHLAVVSTTGDGGTYEWGLYKYSGTLGQNVCTPSSATTISAVGIFDEACSEGTVTIVPGTYVFATTGSPVTGNGADIASCTLTPVSLLSADSMSGTGTLTAGGSLSGLSTGLIRDGQSVGCDEVTLH